MNDELWPIRSWEYGKQNPLRYNVIRAENVFRAPWSIYRGNNHLLREDATLAVFPTHAEAIAYALDECEPEIRDVHHRIAAGEDLTGLATHTLSPGASGTFLPKTAPDAVTEPENAQIGNIQQNQEGLFA